MNQRYTEPLDAAVHANALCVAVLPDLEAATTQKYGAGRIERGAEGPAFDGIEKPGLVASHVRRRFERRELAHERVGNEVIGIQGQNPRSGYLLDSEGPLRRMRVERPRNDAYVREPPGDGHRSVSAQAVDDDDLTCPRQLRQRSGDVRFLVACEDQRRDAIEHRGHGTSPRAGDELSDCP